MRHDNLTPSGESDCRIVEELLSPFFDEELNDTADAYVRHHLDACEACTTKLEEIKATVMAINSLPRQATPEEDLWAGVVEKSAFVATGPLDDREQRRDGPWYTKPMLLAAAIAGILVPGTVAGMFFLRDGDPPRGGEAVLADAPAPPPTPAMVLPAPPEPHPAPDAPVPPELAERALQELRRALTDENADVRRMAVQALGEAEDPRAVDALTNALLTDVDADVRSMAAWALGEIEHVDAVPGLTRALRQDADVGVQRMCVWALGEIEDPAAVPVLIDLLDHADVGVRSNVVWALGEIEHPDAVPGLGMILRNDPDADLRKNAAWALGEIEDPSAVEVLLSALQTDAYLDVRYQAAWALGEIELGTEAVILGLTDALGREAEVEVRRQIVWALGEIRSPLALDALVKAMNDADPGVRTMAAWAIAEINH